MRSLSQIYGTKAAGGQDSPSLRFVSGLRFSFFSTAGTRSSALACDQSASTSSCFVGSETSAYESVTSLNAPMESQGIANMNGEAESH